MGSSSALSDDFLHCVFILDHLRICSHFPMSYSLPHRALQKVLFNFPHILFSSVAQPCLTFCNPMDCSTPGFPVLHNLPEFAQTHVHLVSDAIQPSYPLLHPFPLPSVFPSMGIFPVSWLFVSGGQSIGASASASVLPMNVYG